MRKLIFLLCAVPTLAHAAALNEKQTDVCISLLEAAMNIKLTIDENIGDSVVFFTHYDDPMNACSVKSPLIGVLGAQAKEAYRAHKHQPLPTSDMLYDPKIDKKTKLFNQLIRFGDWLEKVRTNTLPECPQDRKEDTKES